jgi:hypothetical protein
MRVAIINAIAFAAMGALLASLGATWETTKFWAAMGILGTIQLNSLLSD